MIFRSQYSPFEDFSKNRPERMQTAPELFSIPEKQFSPAGRLSIDPPPALIQCRHDVFSLAGNPWKAVLQREEVVHPEKGFSICSFGSKILHCSRGFPQMPHVVGRNPGLSLPVFSILIPPTERPPPPLLFLFGISSSSLPPLLWTPAGGLLHRGNFPAWCQGSALGHTPVRNKTIKSVTGRERKTNRISPICQHKN